VSTVHVFDTPGDVSLQVRLPSGRVVVTTADEPTTTVEIVDRRGQDAVDEIDVTMDERRGEHVIRIEQKDRFRWGPIQITWGGDFECRITCPDGANLDLSGGSTDAKVDGELGEVSVRTASGDVRLDTVRAELQVKTASGNVWLDAAEADASVATVSGNVELGYVAGSLTARTVSGTFKLGAVAVALGVSTTSGDVEVGSVGGGDVRVQSVSGDVRIGIGRGTRVWVDATSVSGTLESELGLEDHQDGGDEEDGAVPLHVKTVSGDVSIVRAAAVSPA
jgi:Putative adhesin